MRKILKGGGTRIATDRWSVQPDFFGSEIEDSRVGKPVLRHSHHANRLL
jgi:hypothetical protein